MKYLAFLGGLSGRCLGGLGAASVLLAITLATASAQVASFPGALGYGAATTGGRGYTVYHVTNLNDSGSGSFRDAVGTSNRTVVFDVGGYIHALGPIVVKSNITIAGQTAPGDGIGVYGCEVSYTGSSNVITRFFRFRDGTQDPNYPGSSSTNSHTNAVNLGTTTNMIFDHCSFEFAAYNNVDAVGAVNLTFQSCIFADPIKEQQFNCHFETGPATFINNLWANAHNRNPLGKGNLQYLDNVIYNYQAGFTSGNTAGKFSYDMLNNYFITGPSTTSATNDYFQVPSNCKAYAVGNLLDSNKDGTLNGSADNSVNNATVLTAPWNSGSPALATAAGENNAADVFKYVVSNAGPLPLDQVDAQVQGNVLSLGKTGMMWSSETATGLGNGGYGVLNGSIPLPDSDGDGMPDVWENAVGLNPNSAADGATVTASGYTNTEVYLNWLCAPHGIVFKNTSVQPTSVDIDLNAYTKGYAGTPTFTVSGATNGAISLLADGHTAHFVPTLNFSGLGSYSFSVTDGVSTMTQTVGVLISATAPPVDVTWYGDNTANVWDTSTANWRAPNNSFIPFAAGDGVTFDDTGSTTPAVNLSGSLAPSEIAVNANQNNYTLSGSGALTGSMNLVKNGYGTLTISNTGANTFSGGALLNAGNIALGLTSGLGTGAVSLGGVSLALPGGGGTFGNALVLNGPSSLAWTSSSNMYLASTVTGSSNFSLNFAARLLTISGNWSGYTGTMDTGTSTGYIRLYSVASVNFGGATVNLGNCRWYDHVSVGQTLAFGALNGNTAAILYGSDLGSTGTDTVAIGALNTNSVFNGAILNSSTNSLVGLTKTGAGTLTLGGTSSYTGPTAVNGGTLAVLGALGNTAVTVTTGSLVGTGTIGTTSGGAVSMKTGTLISPGLAGTGNFGTLTVGNGLTLNGATMALDLSSNPSGNNDKVALQSGTLTLTGTNPVALTLTDGVLGAGVYNLITGGTATTGSTSNLSLGLPSGARQTFVVAATGGKVTLTVTGTAATLTWQGGQSGGLWNANSTANWSNAGAADKFYNFDAVVFDDTASSGTVSMSGSIQPRSTLFNNGTLAYTLNGPGTLDGTGALTKNGAGTLTINSYYLVSATTTTTSTTVQVAATTGMFVGQPVTGTGIAAGTTVASLVDATHITVSLTPTAAGTNNLTFYTLNTFSGGTTINGGTVALGSAYANAAGLGTGAVTLNGGTLTMYSAGLGTDAGNLSNPLVVNTMGTLNTAPRCTVGGTLSGSGTLTYNTTYVRTALAGDWSAFTGQINVTGGGNFRITPSYYYPGFPLAGVRLTDNVSMYFAGTVSDTGTSVPIGELSGTASSILLGGPSSSGGRPFSWIVGGKNTSATFAGSIVEQAAATTVTSINKVGTGVWTLSGASSFNGDLLIQGGTLVLSGNGSITNGGSFEAQSATTVQLAGGTITTASVQIDGGATLAGCGTINGSLSSQGTVLVNCGGGLTINGDVENDGTLRLANGSTLNVTGQFTNTGVLDLLAGTSSLPANLVNTGTVLDSSLVRAQSATRAAGVFTVTILGYAGHGYQLQSSTSLSAPNWQNVGGVQTVSSGQSGPVTLTFQDSGAASATGFYRIVVAP